MSGTASRDLASEIGRMFQENDPSRAVAFIDALIAGGDYSDIDRLRAANPGQGAHALRNLLSRRIDTAPLPGGGMAAVFAVTVFGCPRSFDADALADQIAASWGPGLTSLSIDRSYRGSTGLPATPESRMALASLAAAAGPAAAIAALPRVKRKPKRPWDPSMIVCVATTKRGRDEYEIGSNILFDSISDALATEWSDGARERWAGLRHPVYVPELLGSAIELSRQRSVLQRIGIVASWAKGGMLDILRLQDGDIVMTSLHGGSERVSGAGLLHEANILSAAMSGGAVPEIRHPLSIARCH
ncbi:hypothetical protein BHAOGJBA_4207 [Methylobacterium hispanicum]|uniref:Uncharacterized protein n=1 Tax=Methylobacterium hispanicum TaxID=270350 RepID=A0AAV4ZQ44_9HYPH|nr:hypothetical protein [Methylobacterium hispanicum]GJD90665.1 hypothetical protein BHAOGJBA_4207 [Methylobacterium hispanicum]